MVHFARRPRRQLYGTRHPGLMWKIVRGNRSRKLIPENFAL